MMDAYINIHIYTRLILPDFNARADTYTRCGLPSTIMRTFCKFAFQLRRFEFSAWERLLPDPVLRPVITHCLAI